MGGDINDLAYYESVKDFFKKIFAKYVIVSCELTDLILGISQHFSSTVVMEENNTGIG